MTRFIVEAGLGVVMVVGAMWMVPSDVHVESVLRPSVSDREQRPHTVSPKVKVDNSVWPLNPVRVSRALRKRNIFNLNGSYDLPSQKRSQSGASSNDASDHARAKAKEEEVYGLVAVFEGEEPLAIFRDSSGALLLRKEGDQLTKHAQITRITRLTVTVRKRKKDEVYRIFDIEGDSEGDEESELEVGAEHAE